MTPQKIHKYQLSNGLTILVVPLHRNPQVSVQLWYHVGSKDERSGQKGIAHLIEHMIFKGTELLSESDINEITHKLSGSCNAFTSHDYTGYLFDFPSHHWHEALPIMADCMRNCTFKENFLNSELKAVVQELKMYRDDYISTIMERMMGGIFADHPYRYPIIGYKQDLWNLRREALLEFYNRHYIPNNATLVVVGDVTPEEVHAYADRAFGSIPANFSYKRDQYYHAQDLDSVTIKLERDVQQPIGVVAWEVPGVTARKDYHLDITSWVLGSGKGSRLYRTIVDELELATDLDSFTYDLFDHGLFAVTFQPKEGIAPERVAHTIQREITRIVSEGISDAELKRAVKKTEMDLVSLQEQHQKYAYLIGKYYTALQDEQYCAEYTQQATDQRLNNDIHDLMATYLRPAIMHEGYIVPVAPSERMHWIGYQERSDAEDNIILSRITRDVEVEEGSHVATITVVEPKPFEFPRAEKFILSNGLEVRFHNEPSLPTLNVVLELPFKHYFDPEEKQGLAMFLVDLMQEGTKTLSAAEFAEKIEGNGMSLNIVPGLFSMRMLASDIQLGCNLLADMLMNPALDSVIMERVRYRLLSDLKSLWDTPTKCAAQLLRGEVYAGHPYHKAALGTVGTLSSITQGDLVAAHRAWISPRGACVAVVGDLTGIDVKKVLEETLGAWTGSEVERPQFPSLHVKIPPVLLKHPMQRDQTVLAYGRLSVERRHPDFDKLLLFDQVFTGGALGSMSSRLFELRERSGLFYTINGSLVAGAGKQPGMTYISTIVSPDRLEEAELRIKEVIDEGAKSLTQEELDEARRAIETMLVESFATHRQTAGSFLFLHEYGLGDDYFDNRMRALREISRESVQEAVARVLQSDTLNTILVGRV